MNDTTAQDSTDPIPESADTAASETTDTVDNTATEAPDEAQTAQNREAAKYRRRLRETETDRDALAGRLAALQRAEAERIATAHLADGADLFRDGADLGALLDDEGHVDPVKVSALAKDIAEQHPHWVKKALPPKQIRRGGLSSGASTTADQSTPSWAALLNVGHRR